LPMMTAHQAEQPTVLATFRVILLPELQEVLVHQTHHVEAVGHDDGIGEVLLSDATVRFRQIHHNHGSGGISGCSWAQQFWKFGCRFSNTADRPSLQSLNDSVERNTLRSKRTPSRKPAS